MAKLQILILLTFLLDLSQTSLAESAISATNPATEIIQPYQARAGHTRPLIAVIAENRMTELVDFVVPYGVLSQANIADVLALSTQSGPVQMMPALQLQTQATVAEFDQQHPEGADYLIVPAVHYSDDPLLVRWVKAQADKGAIIVGICDGVLVLGNAGLLQGRRATGHWHSQSLRENDFPSTHWLKNIRYVADGNIISTAGVSAALPVSLALIEAIGGSERANLVARQLGVRDWSAKHDSEVFEFSSLDYLVAARNLLSIWEHQQLGIPVVAGFDEVALALRADAYARTFRSTVSAVAVNAQPITSRHGLMLLPETNDAQTDREMLPAASADTSAVSALDRALLELKTRYGDNTTRLVALQLEYPQTGAQ